MLNFLPVVSVPFMLRTRLFLLASAVADRWRFDLAQLAIVVEKLDRLEHLVQRLVLPLGVLERELAFSALFQTKQLLADLLV